MTLSKARTRDVAVRVASSVGKGALLPFRAMAWTGNNITGGSYAKLDQLRIGRFNIGDVFKEHANKILVPLSYCGDSGYVGYALEQGGKSLQASAQFMGALSTLPASTVLLLIGDENPPLMRLADKMPDSTIGNAFKSISKYIVNRKKHIIPASWVALSLNGLSMVAAAATKPIDIGQTVNAATPYLPQAMDLLLRGPEFAQGAAIFAGTTALAVNQYLRLSKQDDSNGLADKAGELATGILSFCTAMTCVTAIVDKSPSLMVSAGAFLALNYCQYRLSKPNAPTP